MPLYEYECQHCGWVNEQIHKVTQIPEMIQCEKCGYPAKKILSGHGAIMTDNKVKWLPSAVKALQPDYEKPIETRTEYKNYLKKNHLAPKA